MREFLELSFSIMAEVKMIKLIILVSFVFTITSCGMNETSNSTVKGIAGGCGGRPFVVPSLEFSTKNIVVLANGLSSSRFNLLQPIDVVYREKYVSFQQSKTSDTFLPYHIKFPDIESALRYYNYLKGKSKEHKILVEVTTSSYTHINYENVATYVLDLIDEIPITIQVPSNYGTKFINSILVERLETIVEPELEKIDNPSSEAAKNAHDSIMTNTLSFIKISLLLPNSIKANEEKIIIAHLNDPVHNIQIIQTRHSNDIDRIIIQVY